MPIEITGRVIDRQTGEGVPGLRLELWPLEVAVDQPLAAAETREAGVFFAEVDERLFQELRGMALYFRVLRDGELITSTEQTLIVRPDLGVPEIVVEVDLSAAEPPVIEPPFEPPVIEPPVIELPRLPLADLGPVVGAPPELLARLAENRITTLGDILAAGGLRRIEGLPANDPAVRTLEAHANLSILPTDVQTNVQLIERGYTSPVAIASRARTEFITSAAGALGIVKAGQLYQAAQAQTALLSNTLTGILADRANGYFTLEEPVRPCECKDCRAAVSPLAYLADLLDYASNHLRRDFSHLMSGSRPTVCSWGSGRLDIFSRGKDDTLWHAWYQNSWSLWESLGGALASEPAAVSWGLNRIDVVVGGTDGALWHKWFDGTWHEWESLGGVLNSNPDVSISTDRAPAMCSWGPGRLDVFVIGTDGALWHKWFENAWSSWVSRGGTGAYPSSPAAVSWGPNRIDVFVMAGHPPPQWMLFHKWFDGTWHEESLGRVRIPGDPTVCSWGSGRLDIFMRGPNGPDHQWYDNGWSTWESLGGGDLISSQPAAVSWGSNRIDVFAWGTDDTIYQKNYDTTWSDWKSGGAINIDFLTKNFYQPFTDLPVSCQAMETQVRQVRLCIEVLWRYLNAIWPSVPPPRRTALAQAEASYVLAAYQTLLVMIGTSYDEIRLIRSAPADEKSPLADRLGIDLLVDGVNTLDELFLAPTAITQPKLEDLFGLVDTDPRRRDPLAPSQPSKMQKWRLRHLRTLWRAQDWPPNPYSKRELPVIDPDIINPDDFRNPVAKANVSDPDQPFDLWLKRRIWVDARLAAFAGLLKNARGQQIPNLETMLQTMYQNVTYEGTSLAPWTQPQLSDLGDLLKELRGSDKQAAQTAAETVQTNLHLPVEAFARLMDIREKTTRWENSQSDDAVTEAEWSEVYSILAQAQKAVFFNQWVAEETRWANANGRLLFSPQHFWPSLREPKEGDWSSTLPSPRLDPEIVRLNDLWEPAVRDAALRPADPNRDRALQWWQERQQELANSRSELQDEYEANGFAAMLLRALGDPNPGDALPYDLDDLKNDLDSGDAEDVEQATSDIENGLYMSVQDFNRLMLVRLKVNNKRKPTKADMDAVYAILTTAEKRKRRYGTWTNKENATKTGVRYWQALKARLPRWRATSEARQAWRQALSLRSQPPIIDPDVIDAGHLREQTGDAYTLWETRTEDITDQIADLGTNPKTLAGLDTILEAVVGIGEEALGKLAEKRDQGEGVAAQLAQLNLATDAFVYLARIRALLAANQPVLDDEWASVYAILTQVWKQRQFADWRAEEEAAGIILSQDAFQIPEIQVTTFPPPPPPELPAWRATWRARQDWEDTLQSRIELEETILEELRQAVSETEEAVLPRLRDALVLATDAVGKDLAEKVRWITGRLLIDAQMDGCQMTTRIAQAIETLLNLLWSARLGQLDDLGVALTLDAPNFDQEWRWIGSYATWRAAMFVFMYPDNLLLPSLKRQQTPAFRDLVNALRSGRRLTPERARQIAAEYERYWGDVRSLKAVASCYARVGRDLQPRYFMVAVGGVTNTLYWSAYDPQGEQTLWAVVPGLNPGSRVIGVVPFNINPDRRYLYLFAISSEQDKPKAVFTRYDLVNRRWDTSPVDLDVPQNADIADLVVKQTTTDTRPPHLAVKLTNREIQTMQFNALGGQGTWTSLFPPDGQFAGNRRFSVENLRAMVEIGPGEYYLFAYGADVTGPGLAGVTDYFTLVDVSGVRRWMVVAGVYPSYVAAFNWPGTPNVYVLFYGGGGVQYRLINRNPGGDPTLTAVFPPIPSLETIPLMSGEPPANWLGMFLVQRTNGIHRATFAQGGNSSLTEASITRVAPRLEQPLAFTEELSAAQLQERQTATQMLYNDNVGGPNTNLVYWAEGCYFVPISLALQLQRVGEYVAALDWFRTVYDFTIPESQRKIYYGLRLEESLPPDFPDRAANWLLDPLNPHAIAATRRNTYTRYTLLSLIRCILDYADAEFTRDTAESVPRARILYTTALELMAVEELKQKVGECDALIGSIDIEVDYPRWVPIEWLPVWNGLVRRLRNIDAAATLTPVVQQIKAALVENRPWPQFFAEMSQAITEAENAAPLPRLAALVENRSLQMEPTYTALLAQPMLAETAARVGTMVVTGNGVMPVFPPFRDDISEIYVPTITYDFCIPPNPVLKALRLRAELNLYKIRTCRNIAGMERQLEPYAAPTDTVSGLPVIGAGGQLVLPGTATLRPTPYRYSVLIERAKHLVSLAQQIEAAFLSALEKRDAEAYTMLKARQDIRLARAGVRLQELRVKEAEDSVKLAELQKQRSQIQLDTYTEWIDAGLSQWENVLITAYQQAGEARIWANFFETPVQAVQAATSVPNPYAAAALAATVMAASFARSIAIAAETTAQIANVFASFERRKQEWELQKKLAQHDLLIGDQQIVIAQDHVRVVGQERVIAEMETEHAEATADFLANKFTNTDLYEWMIGVLEEVYSYFLQQATSMAQLASNQLAFERHEVPPPFIQADYWEVPSEDMSSDGAQGPDRRGLTGSARLLRDIYQLDQYAFEMNQRKLQLSKMISLTRLAPAEFQRFRETGVMTFATPMELFDRDFPGHYLRLIHKVRVSVVALIPPTQGIRATLTASGLSRVVIDAGDIFQTVTVRREPQTIALSSPANATGLFELDPQSDLLAPFETMGVDTSWEFRMPKAANPFDYRTLADVLVTIEYTALNSFDYRAQVIQALPTRLSADQLFSMRHRFPDQWYDLHNPELLEEGQRMVVRFKTVREDFPPNLEGLQIQRVALYIAGRGGVDIRQVTLYFSEQGSSGRGVGGDTQPNDGLASWMAMNPRVPVGEWELALPDNEDVRNRFKNEEIEDILLVITYSGQTPEWPV